MSPQSLMMMNNQHVRHLAKAFASRVAAALDDQAHDLNRQVDTVYRLALSRSPTEEERQTAVESLNVLQLAWQGDGQAALESFCHTILNSAAFLYID